MNVKYVLLMMVALAVLFACNPPKQGNSEAKSEDFVLAFYNVENLFDTLDDPNKRDEDFTPTGRKEWNGKRYTDKLDKLSKVLSSLNGGELPWAFGLCEVENKAVVEALIAEPALAKGDYKIVHFESPDERGIDVAFVYQNDKMEIMESEAIETPFSFDPEDKTRDILYVKAKFKGTETSAHIFINHWPSRSGGLEKSEPKRLAVAQFLKDKTDALLKEDPEAHIISLGDYNDETNNNSIVEVLQSKPVASDADLASLYNLAAADDQAGLGSYHYWRENQWNMIDQAIVSGQVLKGDKGLKLLENKMLIFKEDWIMHTNDDGSKVPNKTYGKGYYGGYSDHLPVYLKLQLSR